MARQCGYPHYRPMLEHMRLTSSELGEAIAYDNIDPCGEYRQELRHGQMMQLHYMANFKQDENNPVKPVDFMNFTNKPEEPELTVEQVKALSREAMGAGRIRKPVRPAGM